MKYQAGDVVEFQLNLGGEPVANGVIVDTLVHDYKVLPEAVDALWVVHPTEIRRKIGHMDIEKYLSARFN